MANPYRGHIPDDPNAGHPRGAPQGGGGEPVQQYGEWLVPLMRRRRVPAADTVTFIATMAPAARTVLTPAEAAAAEGIIERWIARQGKAKRLAGARKRTPVLSFFWKGVGIAD